MRLLRVSIRLGVLRTHRDVAEAHRLQHPADAALVQEHKEPIQDTAPEVRQAPTHQTVFLEARTLADPGRKLCFLFWVQPGFRITRMRLVRQAGHTAFIVAMQRVTQRLPVHTGRTGRIRSGGTVHDHRQRQKPAGNLRISLTRGQRTQTCRVMLHPGDHDRHRTASCPGAQPGAVGRHFVQADQALGDQCHRALGQQVVQQATAAARNSDSIS